MNMRKAIVVAALVGFSAVVCGVGTAWVAAATGETALAPGATVFPADVSGTAAGTLLATQLSPYSYTTTSGTNSGAIASAVYLSGGTIDFYIQVNTDATSATPIALADMDSFQGVSTSVGYRTDGSTLVGTAFVDGTAPPVTASRDTSGVGVSWDFYPPASETLQPGEISDVMVVATNATNFGSGNVSVVDGGTATVLGFEPLVADADLALTNVPASIMANATSPSGAVVTYTPPTVVDEDSPLPTVGCAPASGSTFAIGPTTVTCSVSDSDDSNSPVSASFTVTVIGAAAQLKTLLAFVQGLPPGASLRSTVQLAINDLPSNPTGACSELAKLIKETKAQTGKHLTTAQATSVITAAEQIEAVIAC
jgi:HYR domain